MNKMFKDYKVTIKNNLIQVYGVARNNKKVWCGSFTPLKKGNDKCIELMLEYIQF